MKFSNYIFYKRHNLELERFLYGNESLHIINIKSREKINERFSNKYFYDTSNEQISVNELKRYKKKFDVIVVTDVIELVDDLNSLIIQLSNILKNDGKLIISSINTKFNLIIKIFEFFKLKDLNTRLSYTHNQKIKYILYGYNFEFINTYTKQIFPFSLFGLGNVVNKIFEVLFFKFNIGIKTYTVFRKKSYKFKNLAKTIIIPAKNEAGNLNKLVSRIPKFTNSQIIISCGESEDNTFEVANQIKKFNPKLNIHVFTQSGKGKANAIWESFKFVKGELIAILDADISVDPETLIDFYKIIEENNADFVNGTRLVYQMEKGSMRYLNKIGNRLFQSMISFVIKNPLTDSLCGTKVFKKDLINKIFWWQDTFEIFDPFGDFDLLFTAAYSGQKIVEYPVHYRSRIYGKTQISRFKDGFSLLIYFIKSLLAFSASR